MSASDQIKALDSEVADGVISKNSAAVASQYAEDAAILPPGTGQIDGKETIQSYWKAGIDAWLSDVSIVATTVEVFGGSSVTVGTLSGKMGDADLTGKHIEIGRKTEDGWRIHRDIWNFNSQASPRLSKASYPTLSLCTDGLFHICRNLCREAACCDVQMPSRKATVGRPSRLPTSNTSRECQTIFRAIA